MVTQLVCAAARPAHLLFIWTKTAKQIITKVRRGRVALESAGQSGAV